MILGHEFCIFSPWDSITVANKAAEGGAYLLLTAFLLLTYFPLLDTLFALESLSQGLLLGEPNCGRVNNRPGLIPAHNDLDG